MRRASAKLGAMVLLLLIGARPAGASPADTFGFGSRSTAMAGAVSAEVQDFSANYYNPAGLARARRLGLGVGYFRASHHLGLDGKDTDVDPVRGLVAGAVAPGTVAGLPLAFGVGLHLPDDRLSRVRALPQEQPRWELYDNRNQRLYFAVNLAASPWPWLQLGGGVAFMASARARVDITGSANVFSPADSQLRHEVDADITLVRIPQLGARVALAPRVALAVVYRGESHLDLDLDARLSGDVSQLTTAYYRVHATSVNAFVPRQVVLGAAWEATRDLGLRADLTWINWASYVSPVARLDVELDIPPPKGGWPAGISPPATPTPTRILPLGMRDRIVPRLGAEWRAVHLPRYDGFLRGGYEYARSPLPPQRGITNFVDRDRHAVSLGVGVAWRPDVEELPREVHFDLHAQLAVLPEGTVEKDRPTDLVGDYRAGGHIWNVGLSTSVGF